MWTRCADLSQSSEYGGDRDMPVDVSSLSLDKALSMALRSEVDAEAAYKKLQKTVKNFILKDKLQFLIHEEKKHQKLVKAPARASQSFPGWRWPWTRKCRWWI
jgi:rubrerythrin